MNSWMTFGFQDAMSPIMHYMNFFHEFIMTTIIFITIMILYMIIMMYSNKFYTNYIINHQTIEFIWTVFPLMILFMLVIPSIKILYMTDETKMPFFTIKSIGNQWYWSYEYPQFLKMPFDSYMINTNEIKNNEFRLLEVDNRLIAPYKIKTQLVTTSNDVIHSFTVPSLGFKIDSIPGRLNKTTFLMKFAGLFYGQCSEICGVNHSFMPIVIESINKKKFFEWILN
uniref:cytochrome c oxidase subunit II n=1 Tax=Telenomus remus TaxID=1569972 RepID=UPI001E281B8A|nr:cytochrome c oxidase subunit II [Telenomus remus]QTE20721.1 cytochrome c oxidase subunit II [Telenomus remus]